MKIVIVTTRVPYPPHKGDKLKIFNIVKYLSKNNSVKVLCLTRGKSEARLPEGIRALGAEIETVKHSFLKSVVGAATGFFTSRPIQVSLYRSRKLGKRLAEIIRTESPDVVYFHFIRGAQYIEYAGIGSQLNVLDFTDAVSLYLSRFADKARNPFTRIAVGNERDRIARYEFIAEKFGAAFICSELDRDYLKGRGVRADFHLLPNGVDTESFKESDEKADPYRVIFTGNMPYFPNEDAILHFVKDIWPMVVEKVPKATLYIVGRKPTRKIRSLASEKIFVTGFVEDIAAEYRKSAVAVAPTRFGAGTLNKVIEAIVLGVPVVATSIGVRGLPHEAQKFVRVADDDSQFAREVAGLLGARNGEARYSAESLAETRRILSWESILGDFEAYLRSRRTS